MLFTHPYFLEHQSMPRFAKMIADGMRERGHEVKFLTPEPLFYRASFVKSLRKWMGYLDQYLVFPMTVQRKLKEYPAETLFVFADQALGPWVPLVKGRPHVIHCHDFLAQYSAEGEIPENKTTWTGRKYQGFIRNGYKKGKNFISVSEKTRQDLHYFLSSQPDISEVIYNGTNSIFIKEDSAQARSKIEIITGIDLKNGYLLHVGGNQWYKNRRGVIEIYDSWRSAGNSKQQLLLIGARPDASLMEVYQRSTFKEDIYFLSNIKDEDVKFAYAGASLFLYPSLAEGFGWPIAEAMACGCPVITTNEAPMSEVAGNAAYLIPKRPYSPLVSVKSWAENGSSAVEKIMSLSSEERKLMISNSLSNALRFDTNIALNKIEEIYLRIVQKSRFQ